MVAATAAQWTTACPIRKRENYLTLFALLNEFSDCKDSLEVEKFHFTIRNNRDVYFIMWYMTTADKEKVKNKKQKQVWAKSVFESAY